VLSPSTCLSLPLAENPLEAFQQARYPFAISSNMLTVFQFLVVAATFNFFSKKLFDSLVLP